MSERVDNLAEQLSAVMSKEKRHLLKGEFGKLEQLEAEKEGLLKDLQTAGPLPVPVARSLKQKASENAALYQAAQQGFARARFRIAEVRSALSELKTYSGTGAVHSESTAFPTISKKA